MKSLRISADGRGPMARTRQRIPGPGFRGPVRASRARRRRPARPRRARRRWSSQVPAALRNAGPWRPILGRVLRRIAAALRPVLRRAAALLGTALVRAAILAEIALVRVAVALGQALAWTALRLWRFLRWATPALGRLLPPFAAMLRRALARGAVLLARALWWTAAVLGHTLRRAAALLGKALVRIAVLLWVALAEARAAQAVPRLVTVTPASPWWLRDRRLRDLARPSRPSPGGRIATSGPQASDMRRADLRAHSARATRPRDTGRPMPQQAAQPPIALAETTEPLRALPGSAQPPSAWPEITPAPAGRTSDHPAAVGRVPGPDHAARTHAGPDGHSQASRRQASAGQTGWRAATWVAAVLLWSAVGVVLFLCYLRVSRTASVDSDGASNVLQAWDMLHGNPILRGWRLSDVSFYTTELPQYMLVELVRGISPDVVHIAGAITYSLLVLLTALLAKGQSAGRPGLFKAALAGGIMLAPQLGSGVYVLLLAPDHVGSTVPVMLVWLLLDRARRRWYVPAAAGVLLTWALIADNIVLITGVLPLAVVCATRVYRATVVGRRPLWASWFELALITAAVVAAQLARTVLAQITAHGGFTVAPVDTRLAAYAAMPQHLLLTGQGMLLLFGADFFGHNLGLVAALAMLHLVGLVLAAAATWAAVRRFVAGRDLVTQILAAGVTVSLGAYLISHQVADLHSTREVAAALPFAAALAGRVLGPRLERARMVPAVALLLAGYLVSLGRVMSLPPVPAQNQQLATWLSAHGLQYGLAGYWQASSTTVASGGRVAVRPVGAVSDGIRPFNWETDSSWFDPAAHDANFIVLYPSRPGADPYPWITDVRAAFGAAGQNLLCRRLYGNGLERQPAHRALPIRPVTPAPAGGLRSR